MRVKCAAVAAAALVLVLASPLSAETLLIDFENPPYTPGHIHLQDGWSSSGAAGMGCAVYDHRVVANSYGYAEFGDQSLRASNAVTSGCFGDQTYSKSLANDAGEPDAEGGAWSGGLRQARFEASWQFASTVPGAQQAGLSVVASPDRGDGARMSWVQMADGPAGLEVNFYDYQDLAPFGSDLDPDAGCDGPGGDNFFFTPLVTDLDRSVPHEIRIVMDFVPGPRNDVVKVYVDGVLLHVGTSWEDYFRYCEGNLTRPVDSILFRTAGGAAPATLGNGFVIDNMTLVSSARPVRMDLRPNNSANQINTRAKQLVPVAIFGEEGFDPVVDVELEYITMQGAQPLATKVDTVDLDGDGYRDLTVYFRASDIDPPSPSECANPDAMIVLEGVTITDQAFTATDDVTWQGC